MIVISEPKIWSMINFNIYKYIKIYFLKLIILIFVEIIGKRYVMNEIENNFKKKSVKICVRMVFLKKN